MHTKIAIQAYALNYHIKYSKSHSTLVTVPLKPYANIRFEEWDGVSDIKSKSKSNFFSNLIIFFQYPPPEELLGDKNFRLVWIPMWDHIKNYPLSWWEKLPKILKVVAFSRQVYNIATKRGLNTVYLKYFPDVNKYKKATWNKKRVLFYWNRIGLVESIFLKKFCSELKIDKLIFKSELDPGIGKRNYYQLPRKIDNTIVEEISGYLSKQKYREKINEANIFISPRRSEGVGLTFLEYLSKGGAVFSYNSPTMNEYIEHGGNGFLFKSQDNSGLYKTIITYLNNKLGISTNTLALQSLNINQNWKEMQNINLKELGDSAFNYCLNGHDKWQKSIKKYADFILDW